MGNERMDLAQELIETTRTSVFLTGRAGTGKTTFLRRLQKDLPKRMAVLAPTGIAAINAGGVTIHSFFQLPFTPYVPGTRVSGNTLKLSKNKVELIRSLDLLVIDEISMVRADLLDAVDQMLRTVRREASPFAGVQLLLIGDLQQLPPVIKEEEWGLLGSHYATPYFFSSLALQQVDYVMVELTEVYRQRDPQFLTLLNAVREGEHSSDLLHGLNSRYISHFTPNPGDGYVQLVTHNRQAHEINEAELAKLPGKAFTYKAEVKGVFPSLSYPTEEQLVLKKGAQVMFVKNDTDKRYFNGMIGEVVEVMSDTFIVQPKDPSSKQIKVARDAWNNSKYGLDERTKEIREIVEGTFLQYPVKLAWAITIHKSQGLTFDRVMIDASHSFSHGQTYVALSRCRTLEGIVLTSPIPSNAIIADHEIDAYMAQMRSRELSSTDMEKKRTDFSDSLLSDLFSFRDEQKLFLAVVEILERNLYKLYSDTVRQYKAWLDDFEKNVIGVSVRFSEQYRRLLSEDGGNLLSPLLQERIRKASEYFSQRLTELSDHVQKLSRFEIDNAALEKRIKRDINDLLVTLKLHAKLLVYVEADGFEIRSYLNERAKLFLNTSGRMAGDERKQKRTSEVKELAKNDKYAVPTEVTNSVLYYRLQQWRRMKAAELRVPVYIILQTKALIAISNLAPTEFAQLKKIPYLGAKGIERFGQELVKLIVQYKSDAALRE